MRSDLSREDVPLLERNASYEANYVVCLIVNERLEAANKNSLT